MTQAQTTGTVVTGAQNITNFAWRSTKMQLKLEAAGMKGRGGAIRPRIAAKLGLKPRDSYEKFYEAIDKLTGF